MADTVYRVTGVHSVWDSEQRKYVPGGKRTTVRRSQKHDLAYYEDLAAAKRGLIAIRAQNRYYVDFRVEELSGEWLVVE